MKPARALAARTRRARRYDRSAQRGALAPPPHPRNRETPYARRSLIDGVEGGPSKPCEAPVQATLVLKDGQRLEGTSFGAKVNRPGEVVFNTGMV